MPLFTSNLEKDDPSVHERKVVKPAANTPLGLQKVYLMNKYASRLDLWIIIVGIVLFAWAKNWEANTTYSVMPNVLSLFNAANKLTLLSTVQYLLQTVLIPFYAKLSDMWGRSEVFGVSLAFYIVSGVTYACAQQFNDFAGAQVLYALGVSGAHCMGHVLIADLTSKVNRGLFQSFYDVPSIINIFVAPIAGQELMYSGNWRWVYSMIPFSILGTAIILYIGLFHVEYKMRKSGDLQQVKAQLKEHTPKRSLGERIKWVLEELDIIGSLLLVGALCMLLLPLVLAATDFGGWQSPTTIGLLVGGAVALVLFLGYEWKLCKKPLIPMGNWDTFTPMAGVLCISMISIITSIPWAYFQMYLQISRNWDIIKATHVDRSYDAVYLVSQVIAGYLMRYFKIYRPIILSGIVLFMVGMGMMIPSRYPGASDVFLVASQVISGFGAGWCFVPTLTAVQSAVPHNDLAIATAMYQVGTTLAYSIGSAIAGAVWNSLLPAEILKLVPGEIDVASAMGDIVYIAALPQDQWEAVIAAYGNILRIFCIVGLCLSVLALAFALMMKPFGLEDDKRDVLSEETVYIGDDAASSKHHEETLDIHNEKAEVSAENRV
ncbi:major facilitator superfamily domain-containing protein [Zychaea mexicana]|uniref:major facilitator superfamily domain-containing protein n=1 Tax=Zychaea mexicana TaxID=64656 RepID=UPI0022FE27CE|nr:major facilitator superfamily domain-containing protein [Zychaea mexicana]KAI9492359.1 major facilitator superfamily domain-containing protein [Zychaea mexicana]